MRLKIFRIAIVLLIVHSIGLCIGSCTSAKPVEAIEYAELGIPRAEQYPDGIRARCPWDMTIFENRLYIGGGDYDANAGPVDVWYYNLETAEWTNDGTVPDEEINRFCMLNGTLVIPGTDSRGDSKYGQYYTLNEGAWHTVQSIEGGLHNFDMVEYHDMLFAGLGVASGDYPIACSRDGGLTFSPVEMQKDGTPLDTSPSGMIRVYDLFVLGDSLYAAFRYGDNEVTYDLYRYDNGVFVFDNQWYQKIHQVKYTSNIIGGKAELNGQLFFTTGHLYATADMANFTRIAFPNAEIVYDLYVEKDCLYALCGVARDDGRYTVSVWENQSGDAAQFTELFHFVYDAPPLSMVSRDGVFYIGIGDFHATNNKNGMILSVKYPGK